MLTQDEDFWKGCKSCVNYDILMMKERKNCMCTAMLWDPEEKAKEIEQKMKKAAELKHQLDEERISKVTRKQTLLQRIEEKLRNSLKVIVTVGVTLVKLLQN